MIIVIIIIITYLSTIDKMFKILLAEINIQLFTRSKILKTTVAQKRIEANKCQPLKI